MNGQEYLEKFGTHKRLIQEAPSEDLGIIVTIPSYNEQGYIQNALLSLVENQDTNSSVEILVLENYPSNFTAKAKLEISKQVDYLKNWVKNVSTDHKKIFIEPCELPEKFAGVGLARKILMDEAVRRFDDIGKEGIVVCYDADCTCEPNYLQTIEEYFERNKNSPGCSIYFEHDLCNEENKQAILDYELYLRYYVQGLKFAKYPFAFHTVGSSMAVRTESYRMQGGMNKRKAAEDFYFLHKIMPMGNFGNITDTKVIPSARVSDRVPFGTGKAMGTWQENKLHSWPAVDPEAFEFLKHFLALRNRIFQEEIDEGWISDNLPLPIREFLIGERFIESISEIKGRTTNFETFEKAFFNWFNGLKVLQLTHFLRDSHLESLPVQTASVKLIEMNGNSFNGSPEDLLRYYRELDRS